MAKEAGVRCDNDWRMIDQAGDCTFWSDYSIESNRL